MLSNVFQIYSKVVKKNYINPWESGNRKKIIGTGTGIMIGKLKYILTNAHIVEGSCFIECIKYNSDKAYELSVINISPEIDLSLLSVNVGDYHEFWDGILFNEFSNNFQQSETIKVIGFPLGGLNSSISKGIISRVHVIDNGNPSLVIQTDASANNGNSGGPVLNKQNKLIGISNSLCTQGQNICYIIPAPIIKNYLDRFEKLGMFDGVCDLDIKISPGNKRSGDYNYSKGIIVNKVNNFGSCSDKLIPRDIIHAIDNITINNDGTIYYVGLGKVPYWYLLRLKSPGDSVSLLITRNNHLMTVNIILKSVKNSLLPSLDKYISNKYYIYCGLIFIPLNNWYASKTANLSKYMNSFPDYPDQQIIILSEILVSSHTSKYKLSNIRLLKINDNEINHIKDVYKYCENLTSDFIKFEFENNNIIKLNSRTKTYSQEISKKYLDRDYTNVNL